ncbi:MAG: class I SAM-dependent methyltransferase [Rhodospirillales bacterium]|nr:class I SAM-dependent methyltransferase [Rhodospirillales bacterium]
MPSSPAFLARHLRQRIQREGPLTVAAFMEDAAGHPRFGYYATRDPLGAGGDFTTAPEISQMFGELIGLWCAVVWDAIGKPDPVQWVELGPGRGTLMADALRATAKVPGFIDAVRLHMIERSPVLRARQKETLARAGRDAQWHDDVSDVPAGPAIVVANEFFDALPIRQFERTQAGWCERLVDVAEASEQEEHAFRFVLSPPPEKLHPIPERLRDAPAGAVVEVCPQALRILHTIATRLAGEGGAAVIVDYGHPESAIGDTLQAVKGHAFADVLASPGELDLTAHVDFGALRDVAAGAGARAHGPVSQGAFLEWLGISARTETLLARASPSQARGIRSAKARLVEPDGMGALFKVFGVSGPALAALPGFAP